MEKAIPSFKEIGWKIAGIWSILFNGLDGTQGTGLKNCLLKRQQKGLGTNFFYLYSGTELFDMKLPNAELEQAQEEALDVISRACDTLEHAPTKGAVAI
jgi:hypothetical protein